MCDFKLLKVTNSSNRQYKHQSSQYLLHLKSYDFLWISEAQLFLSSTTVVNKIKY